MLTEPHTIEPTPPRLDTFTFRIEDIPCATLDFTIFRKDNEQKMNMKRTRPVADVDGEGCSTMQKKKRRLRLDLITSRLSQPYATPTTYIVSRGNIRAAKLLRPRSASRSLLRRAALINCMRRNRAQAQGHGLNPDQRLHDRPLEGRKRTDLGFEQARLGLGTKMSSESHITHTIQSTSSVGLSNYDAIDMEGDPFDDDVWCESPEDVVNSDFNKRDPVDAVMSDLDTFPTLQFDVVSTSPLDRSSKDIMELITDEEKPQEISFAQFS